MLDNEVTAVRISQYDEDLIYNFLPDELFSMIGRGDTAILKPNWVLESHETRPDEWEQVITHPSVITAVIRKTVDFLVDRGKIVLADGPELNADFRSIIGHYPVDRWKNIAGAKGIDFEIIDLRNEQYIQDGNVTINKLKLPGDPCGSVVVNLKDEQSEFFTHNKSAKGYYGAGTDINEVNNAHNGSDNIYKVSNTVIKGDVFINLPKLKTHKKAGITASLKNLVGINTYRNYLPHYTLGTKDDNGDQFPGSTKREKLESLLVPFIKQHLLTNHTVSKFISPLFTLGKKIFGTSDETLRGGSWSGNDTVWRMILDLNKILLFANADGSMREQITERKKKYITVVDAVIAGHGNGPKKPDAIDLNLILCGGNPVSVDAVCAVCMGYDPLRIPSIANAFKISEYKLAGFGINDIKLKVDHNWFSIIDIPSDIIKRCNPHKGWIDYLHPPTTG